MSLFGGGWRWEIRACSSWDFRVLYRSILSQPDSAPQPVRPSCGASRTGGRVHPESAGRAYLEGYFGKGADIDIFRGSSQEFLI